jgi:hypothetical protein
LVRSNGSAPHLEEPSRELPTGLLVGELLYIAINTVPKIIYHLHIPTRYMTRATEAHLQYAKGVLRYLKGVMDRKITWCAANVREPHERHEIWASVDSSFADTKPLRKSTFGYQLFVNNAVFSESRAVIHYCYIHLRSRAHGVCFG